MAPKGKPPIVDWESLREAGPCLEIGELEDIRQLSKTYLGPESELTVCEKDWITNLKSLYRLSKRKTAKMSKEDEQKLESIIVTAFAKNIPSAARAQGAETETRQRSRFHFIRGGGGSEEIMRSKKSEKIAELLYGTLLDLDARENLQKILEQKRRGVGLAKELAQNAGESVWGGLCKHAIPEVLGRVEKPSELRIWIGALWHNTRGVEGVEYMENVLPWLLSKTEKSESLFGKAKKEVGAFVALEEKVDEQFKDALAHACWDYKERGEAYKLFGKLVKNGKISEIKNLEGLEDWVVCAVDLQEKFRYYYPAGVSAYAPELIDQLIPRSESAKDLASWSKAIIELEDYRGPAYLDGQGRNQRAIDEDDAKSLRNMMLDLVVKSRSSEEFRESVFEVVEQFAGEQAERSHYGISKSVQEKFENWEAVKETIGKLERHLHDNIGHKYEEYVRERKKTDTSFRSLQPSELESYYNFKEDIVGNLLWISKNDSEFEAYARLLLEQNPGKFAHEIASMRTNGDYWNGGLGEYRFKPKQLMKHYLAVTYYHGVLAREFGEKMLKGSEDLPGENIFYSEYPKKDIIPAMENAEMGVLEAGKVLRELVDEHSKKYEQYTRLLKASCERLNDELPNKFETIKNRILAYIQGKISDEEMRDITQAMEHSENAVSYKAPTNADELMESLEYGLSTVVSARLREVLSFLPPLVGGRSADEVRTAARAFGSLPFFEPDQLYSSDIRIIFEKTSELPFEEAMDKVKLVSKMLDAFRKPGNSLIGGQAKDLLLDMIAKNLFMPSKFSDKDCGAMYSLASEINSAKSERWRTADESVLEIFSWFHERGQLPNDASAILALGVEVLSEPLMVGLCHNAPGTFEELLHDGGTKNLRFAWAFYDNPKAESKFSALSSNEKKELLGITRRGYGKDSTLYAPVKLILNHPEIFVENPPINELEALIVAGYGRHLETLSGSAGGLRRIVDDFNSKITTAAKKPDYDLAELLGKAAISDLRGMLHLASTSDGQELLGNYGETVLEFASKKYDIVFPSVTSLYEYLRLRSAVAPEKIEIVDKAIRRVHPALLESAIENAINSQKIDWSGEAPLNVQMDPEMLKKFLVWREMGIDEKGLSLLIEINGKKCFSMKDEEASAVATALGRMGVSRERETTDLLTTPLLVSMIMKNGEGKYAGREMSEGMRSFVNENEYLHSLISYHSTPVEVTSQGLPLFQKASPGWYSTCYKVSKGYGENTYLNLNFLSSSIGVYPMHEQASLNKVSEAQASIFSQLLGAMNESHLTDESGGYVGMPHNFLIKINSPADVPAILEQAGVLMNKPVEELKGEVARLHGISQDRLEKIGLFYSAMIDYGYSPSFAVDMAYSIIRGDKRITPAFDAIERDIKEIKNSRVAFAYLAHYYMLVTQFEKEGDKLVHRFPSYISYATAARTENRLGKGIQFHCPRDLPEVRRFEDMKNFIDTLYFENYSRWLGDRSGGGASEGVRTPNKFFRDVLRDIRQRNGKLLKPASKEAAAFNPFVESNVPCASGSWGRGERTAYSDAELAIIRIGGNQNSKAVDAVSGLLSKENIKISGAVEITVDKDMTIKQVPKEAYQISEALDLVPLFDLSDQKQKELAIKFRINLLEEMCVRDESIFGILLNNLVSEKDFARSVAWSAGRMSDLSSVSRFKHTIYRYTTLIPKILFMEYYKGSSEFREFISGKISENPQYSLFSYRNMGEWLAKGEELSGRDGSKIGAVPGSLGTVVLPTRELMAMLWASISKEQGLATPDEQTPTYVSFLLPPAVVAGMNHAIDKGIDQYSELFRKYLPSERVRDYRWTVE